MEARIAVLEEQMKNQKEDFEKMEQRIIKSIDKGFASISKEVQCKIDRDLFDKYLESQNRRIAEIDSKNDRAFKELVSVKEETEENNASIKELEPVKNIYNRAAAASLGIMIMLGSTLIGMAYFIWDNIKD